MKSKKYYPNKIQKFFWSLAIASIGFFSYTVFAQNAVPVGFVVQVNPSSMWVNQTVDMTITAVDANKNPVKDYEGDVFIEIDGAITAGDYIVPNDGFYTFIPQDQGSKIFSKGLQVKIPGTFTVKVSDLIDETIKGEQTIIVGNQWQPTLSSVQVINPVQSGTEQNDTIQVLAKSVNWPNSPFQIFLNDFLVNQWITTEIGDISTFITGAKPGWNALKIQIVNNNNIPVGQSDIINFQYIPWSWDVCGVLNYTPMGSVYSGDVLNFSLSTLDGVGAVELLLNSGFSLLMDKNIPGSFSKAVRISTIWPISVWLIVTKDDGQKQVCTNKASFTSMQRTGVGTFDAPICNSAIWKVKFAANGVDKTSLQMSWELSGTVPASYRIQITYTDTWGEHSQTADVNNPSITLKDLNPDQLYFFQILPLDATKQQICPSSSVYSIKPSTMYPDDKPVAQPETCVIKGIQVMTGMIGDRYFLLRDTVPNADRYIVYRTQEPTLYLSKMQRIGETKDTRLEYPYDPRAPREEFAYFVVEAICKDGKWVVIADIKKVQVWPMDMIFVALLISIFAYGGYRLYVYTK